MDKIKAGVDIIDYSLQLNEAIVNLQEAITKSQSLFESLYQSNDNYEGKAKEEIGIFLSSLIERLTSLCEFYYKAAQFATSYFQEMTYTDEELVKVIEIMYNNEK